jgi:hypothetical protein
MVMTAPTGETGRPPAGTQQHPRALLGVFNLAALAIPVAFLATDQIRHGFLRGEQTILLAAFALAFVEIPAASGSRHPGCSLVPDRPSNSRTELRDGRCALGFRLTLENFKNIETNLAVYD